MINTPIKRHETFTSSFCDKYGRFLDDDQLNEAVIIVNNHNVLVQSLRDMVEIVGANFCSSQDVKQKYRAAFNLINDLEQCK